MRKKNMSDNIYYKDDGEPCQLCVDSDGYCHHHIDMETESELNDVGTLYDGLSRCPHCTTELSMKPVLYQQMVNDARVNVYVEIWCDCTSCHIPLGENSVQKGTLPDVWR